MRVRAWHAAVWAAAAAVGVAAAAVLTGSAPGPAALPPAAEAALAAPAEAAPAAPSATQPPPPAVAAAPVPVVPTVPSPRPSPSAVPAPVPSPAPAPRRPARTAPAAPAFPPAPATGADVSWPNCPIGTGIPERPALGLPLPLPDTRFVVLGLTNGPAFTPDPCLPDLVASQRAGGRWLGAYAVTTFPTDAELATYGGSGARLERLRRVGGAQAAYDVARMREAGLAAPMVWVDVEPSRGRPWSAVPQENLAVVGGVLDGLRAAGLRVGLYTYRSAWTEIAGGVALPELPAWSTGARDRAGALSRCATASPAGGPVWLSQWVADDRDLDVTCPGVSADAFRSAFTR